MNIQRTHTLLVIGSALVCTTTCGEAVAQTNSAQAIIASTTSGCIASPTGSVQFPNLGGASANFGSALTIPYDLANNGKSLRVEVSPHPYNSLNTGVWATTLTLKLNGNTSIAGMTPATNNFAHTAGQYASGRLIPFTSLVIGNNQVCATGKCTGGGEQIIGCTTVTVLPPPPTPQAAIVVTPECCTVLTGPQHIVSYTGAIRFKMSGTAIGTSLRSYTAATLDQINQFASGDYTACFQSPIQLTTVNAATNAPLTTGATINGLPYSGSNNYNLKYVKPQAQCLNFVEVGPINPAIKQLLRE